MVIIKISDQIQTERHHNLSVFMAEIIRYSHELNLVIISKNFPRQGIPYLQDERCKQIIRKLY